MKPTLTVGDLRKTLEGVDDALPLWVVCEAIVDGELDTCWASVDVVGAQPPGSGGLFSPPPFPHFRIAADGVPENQCRECGGLGGKHKRLYCISDEDGADANEGPEVDSIEVEQ